MKLLILGDMRSGKDTLAELLNKHYDMTFKSSSEMAMELFIFDEIYDKYGYSTMEECFVDRVNHRQTWYEMICDYNKDDRARLAKDILEMYDCYVGMRDLEEFYAAEHLFDIVIWVDASERIGIPESTNKIPQDVADMIITNNGTFDEFETKSKILGKMLFEMTKSGEVHKKFFKLNNLIW